MGITRRRERHALSKDEEFQLPMNNNRALKLHGGAACCSMLAPLGLDGQGEGVGVG